MIQALVNGARQLASPGIVGACPCCHSDVIPKCGKIVTWHWAHKVLDCDAWSEPETQWHINWKLRFHEDSREIVIGNHRADVVTPSGLVIEFQHSSISAAEIVEREMFYGRMVWVVDAREFGKNLHFRDRGNYWTFYWPWPRKSWWWSQRKLFLDLGVEMFEVRKIHNSVPCRGWGMFGSYSDFVKYVGVVK